MPASPATGKLAVIGVKNLAGVLNTWAHAFARRQPGTSLRLNPTVRLSADAVAALLDGRAQVALLAREPFPSETAALERKFGHSPLLVAAALGSYDTPHNTDAIAIFVNAANPLRQLTLAQLDAIYSQARRRGAAQEITNWGQLGLGGAWADRPIHPYGMVHRRATGNPPGIVNFLEQRLLLGGHFKAGVRELPDRAGQPALARIAQAVADDPAGIGYSIFSDARPGVRALALAEGAGSPAHFGTPASVAADAYPLTRRAYLCLKFAPDQAPPPVVAAFLRYVLSREGQAAVAADPSGYLPLPGPIAAAERAKIR